MGECLDFFRNFGKTVSHFTISSEMSSTYATPAAAEVKMFMLSKKPTGGGLLVLFLEIRLKGLSAEK